MTETQRNDIRSVAVSFGIAFSMSLVGGIGYHAAFPEASILMFAISYGIPFGIVMPVCATSVVPRIRFNSFLVTIAARTVVWGLAIAVAFTMALCTIIPWTSHQSLLNREVQRAIGSVLLSPAFLLSGLLSLIVVFFITSVYQISRKLGPGVLANWIRGYYYNRREEDRIFMFLDMKDSTMLAEKLGNLKFSALVRDFLQDLTVPVIETQGEVDHYVGDEAILTWRVARGVRNANCVNCFFLIRAEVRKRTKHYLANYGLVPEFKAGMHCGRVVTTEVGEIKSEIVFHGDVMNTAARIESLCNELKSDFLISGDLAALLECPAGSRFTSLGKRLLKGKEFEVELVRVDRCAESDGQTARTEEVDSIGRTSRRKRG